MAQEEAVKIMKKKLFLKEAMVKFSWLPSTASPDLSSPLMKMFSQPSMLKRMTKERKSVSVSGKLSEDQVRKLKQDLEITQGNLDIFNELLTELRPGEV